MRLETYIGDLLYRYQCVTVPGFGSFLTQQQPAQIDTTNHTFYPPSKVISFNPQLKNNDGLLTKYIAESQKVSFEEALVSIRNVVRDWQNNLSSEALSLEGIGTLQKGNEGTLLFTPAQSTNYLMEAYGLSSFATHVVQREVYKEEVVAMEEKAPIAITPESRKKTPVYQYVAAASIALLAFGFFGMKQYASNQQQLQLANEQKAQKIVEQKVQTATFDMGTLPSLELKVVEELPKYHIIGGAFRIEDNADKKVRQLLEKGFNAKRIGKNRYGLHQVSYASVADRLEALQLLRKIKRTENSEAWLLVTK